MATELLPCPFCGGDPELVGTDDHNLLPGWFVQCNVCGASQEIKADTDSGASATEAWNRRTQPAQVPRLTDEEVDSLALDEDGLPNSHLEFARAIEAALLKKMQGGGV